MEGQDDREPVAFAIVSQGRAGFFVSKTGAFVWQKMHRERLLGSVDGAISQSEEKQESKGD
jgi:hypothetical protein